MFCLKQNRNQNSILLGVLAVIPVYGTGKCATLSTHGTFEISSSAELVNIVKYVPLTASKMTIRMCYTRHQVLQSSQHSTQAANFNSADTPWLTLYINGARQW